MDMQDCWSFTCCLSWTLDSSSRCVQLILSLFYSCYFVRCSSELVELVLLPYSLGRSTVYSDKLHDFCITIPRSYKAGFELAVRNSQFVKHFSSLRMNFSIFLKNCKMLKSNTYEFLELFIELAIHKVILSLINTPLLNNNVISQRFIVHINLKLHTSFISIILLRSSKL